ncbi:hypothetical protein [Streptomyces sp. NBC_01334]|uniref:hypothetical protein n=1 Tax=Streptomyces sp. NBC_01334 TaxID=2903827 RepID=UPI002E10161B
MTSTAARTALDLTAVLPVPDLEDLYRDLHRHPELSGQANRTAAQFAGGWGRRGATPPRPSAAPKSPET